jgi:hypothetical protein
MDVIFVRTASPSFDDLEVHRSAHNVARCEIFCGGRVSLHESLAFAIEEVSAFTTRAFSD